MKTSNLLSLFVVLGMAAINNSARGDIVPSPPGPHPHSPPAPVASVAASLAIEVDPQASENLLLVPRKLLGDAQPTAFRGDRQQGAWLEVIPPLGTVVAGIALSLALISGGLWLAHRRSAQRAAVSLLMIVATAGFATSLAWADIASPWGHRTPRPPLPTPSPSVAPPLVPTVVLLAEPIRVKAVDGDTIKLIVTPSAAAKLAKRPPENPTARPRS